MSSAPGGAQIGWDCTSAFPIPDGGTITKLRLKSQSCPSSVGNSVKTGCTDIPFPPGSDGTLLLTPSNSSCDARRKSPEWATKFEPGLPALCVAHRDEVFRQLQEEECGLASSAPGRLHSSMRSHTGTSAMSLSHVPTQMQQR